MRRGTHESSRTQDEVNERSNFPQGISRLAFELLDTPTISSDKAFIKQEGECPLGTKGTEIPQAPLWDASERALHQGRPPAIDGQEGYALMPKS